MRRWLMLIAAGAVLCFSAAAWAQSNDVRDHYRTYRAALAAGDIETADREGEAAWRASEQSAGASAQTAVLAYNLATLRLDDERPRDAAAPARRALELADASDGQVPRENVQLIARLADAIDGPSGAATIFLEHLQTLRNEPHADGAIAYAAAIQFGAWSARVERYRNAQRAYAEAVYWSDHALGDQTLARVLALIGQGAAFTYDRESEQALDAFEEAMRISAPLVSEPAQIGAPPTAMEVAYANARAWRLVVFATGATGARRLERTRGYLPEGAAPRMLADLPPVCEFRLIADPMPDYPSRAQNHLEVGSVALRLAISESGRLLESRVLTMAPGGEFASEVSAVANQWRVEWEPNPDAACRRQTNGVIFFVSFRFRGV